MESVIKDEKEFYYELMSNLTKKYPDLPLRYPSVKKILSEGKKKNYIWASPF